MAYQAREQRPYLYRDDKNWGNLPLFIFVTAVLSLCAFTYYDVTSFPEPPRTIEPARPMPTTAPTSTEQHEPPT